MKQSLQHLRDPRTALATIEGGSGFLQCHVPQTEARPLVDNTFVDMTKTGAGN